MDNASLKTWAADDETSAVCTTLVTDMSSLFSIKTTFNQNIGDWDTSSFTTMESMFQNAAAFNQDISGWTVSSVINMARMFKGATAFNQNISGWTVSQVTACLEAACGSLSTYQPHFTCTTNCPTPTLLVKHSNGVTVLLNPVLKDSSSHVGQKYTLDGTEYTIDG